MTGVQVDSGARLNGVVNTSPDRILDIVAEEVGISRLELDENADFADHGIDELLAKSIISKIASRFGVRLPHTAFGDYPTVDRLQGYLQNALTASGPTIEREQSRSHSSVNPLSVVLQESSKTPKVTIFLFPDGSGTAAAYLRLPPIGHGIRLIGMNSPFLNSDSKANFSVEQIAQIWTTEVCRRQQTGPYILGGWSAGGYYSFEVAKCLLRQGAEVQKLILIDSPCRLTYEALPMEVVRYLSANDRMGNWGTKAPPSWMIQHFEASIRAIANYAPIPLDLHHFLEVYIIWAKDGVLSDEEAATSGLDMRVKVTEMLLRKPDVGGSLGWNKLFQRAKINIANMPGNHFSIVHPPDSQVLSSLLKDVVQERKGDMEHAWREPPSSL